MVETAMEIAPVSENSGNDIFSLSLYMLIDDLGDTFPYLTYSLGGEAGQLLGVRFLENTEALQQQYVYIAAASSFPDTLPAGGFSFIISGEVPALTYSGGHSFVMLPGDVSLSTIFNIASQSFDRYIHWDRELQSALNRDAGILELCKISYRLFRNPLFVHDTHFYIKACPVYSPDMLEWDEDERSGAQMVPLDLIYTFKHDMEYNQTLTTHGSQMFSDKLLGYRILYINLWDQNRYEGRVCICELESSIKKGHFIALKHFSNILQMAFHRRNMEPGHFMRSVDTMIVDILEKRLTDAELINIKLSYLDWSVSDQYTVMMIDIAGHNVDELAAVGVCNYIECLIPHCYALLYKSKIMILTNHTIAGLTSEECVRKLGDMLREGYYKMGVSEVHGHFCQLPLAYRQGEIALLYGNQSDSMVWYYHFADYALDYFVDQACRQGEMELLCSEGLRRLLHYDKQNNTALFETLRVYLETERNAVKTAKDLFVHRSTLIYRLKRIGLISGLDLDNPKTRLHLSISYLLLQRKGKSGPSMP